MSGNLRLELTSVDLASMAHRGVEAIAPAAAVKNIHVDVHAPRTGDDYRRREPSAAADTPASGFRGRFSPMCSISSDRRTDRFRGSMGARARVGDCAPPDRAARRLDRGAQRGRRHRSDVHRPPALSHAARPIVIAFSDRRPRARRDTRPRSRKKEHPTSRRRRNACTDLLCSVSNQRATRSDSNASSIHPSSTRMRSMAAWR